MSVGPTAPESGPRPKTTVLTFQEKRRARRAHHHAHRLRLPHRPRRSRRPESTRSSSGDSLAMVVLGHPDTLSVTMDEMLHHARAVSRGAHSALLVGDMPFMSYQADPAEAVRNAGRFLQEAGMDAVKLEGGRDFAATVRGHRPRRHPRAGPHRPHCPRASTAGRLRSRAARPPSARAVLDDALALEDAGCFCRRAREPCPRASAPSSRSGSRSPPSASARAPGTSGQVLVIHDLLGLSGDFAPKFAKRYAELGQTIADAFARLPAARSARTPSPAPSTRTRCPTRSGSAFLARCGRAARPARGAPTARCRSQARGRPAC